MDQNTLNERAVAALRAYAEALPKTITRMKEDGKNLFINFNSVQDSLGPCKEDILSILNTIKKFQDDSADTISKMVQKLNEKADEIEHFLTNP